LEALWPKTIIPSEQEVCNLHCHTFFSFNAYGYSPTALAWLAKQRGFKALGIVDFDVLDGVDEFLDACERVAVRGSAGMETRVYIPEFSTREINSPGEPGIYYYMGIGFTSSPVPAHVAPVLADMRNGAEQRNRVMVDRLNAHLSPVTIDYDRDVLPLTPAGNATERHLLSAYARAAADHFADPIPFWSGKLNLPEEQVRAQIKDAPNFQTRSRKVDETRRGWLSQPGPDTFPVRRGQPPDIASAHCLRHLWLDGMSDGEQAMAELLEVVDCQGCRCLNIIPDPQLEHCRS
jgi:hypothetical protein